MNYYPELPRLPYQQTTVPMSDVIAYLAGLSCPVEVKRMAYIMFRNEGANGHAGINNNYCGFQADSGRWPAVFDSKLAGTVEIAENNTGRPRLFLAFHRWEDCVDMLVNRVQGRGLYIGEAGIATERDLAECYYRQWVTGNPRAIMPAQEAANFASMYGQAAALFRAPPVDKPQPTAHLVANATADDSADSLNAVEAIEDNEIG